MTDRSPQEIAAEFNVMQHAALVDIAKNGRALLYVDDYVALEALGLVEPASFVSAVVTPLGREVAAVLEENSSP